jgi:hypothetical protein
MISAPRKIEPPTGLPPPDEWINGTQWVAYLRAGTASATSEGRARNSVLQAMRSGDVRWRQNCFPLRLDVDAKTITGLVEKPPNAPWRPREMSGGFWKKTFFTGDKFLHLYRLPYRLGLYHPPGKIVEIRYDLEDFEINACDLDDWLKRSLGDRFCGPHVVPARNVELRREPPCTALPKATRAEVLEIAETFVIGGIAPNVREHTTNVMKVLKTDYPGNHPTRVKVDEILTAEFKDRRRSPGNPNRAR